MINTKIKDLEENIIDLINNSDIPPIVVGMILERLQKQSSIATAQALDIEKESLEKLKTINEEQEKALEKNADEL